MYAISNASRVYITLVFLLCSSLLFAPKVNAIYTWQDARDDFEILKRDTNDAYRDLVKRPSNSTLSTASSPATVAKNPTGGLSVSTNQILKDMGRSTNLTSTSNFTLNSAKTALKSCVRSPSCAGRTLGGGAIIYDGIKAWKDVYDIFQDPETDEIYREVEPDGLPEPDENRQMVLPSEDPPSPAYQEVTPGSCGVLRSNPVGCNFSGRVVVEVRGEEAIISYIYCANPLSTGKVLVGYNGSMCQYDSSGSYDTPEKPRQPLTPEQLDDLIDEGYEPEPSDAPILFSDSPDSSTILRDPESITLSTPAPVQLPSTTTTSTNSAGQTITKVTNQTLNYEITNNDTKTPSINSSVMTTTNTYDSTGNLTETETSTTTEQGVHSEAPSSSVPLELDFELPSFCSWASIVCDWIGWTKEGIEGEEPDLINLISEFEPDENEYNSGIGSGSCPAPMSLNLGIINRTVDVSYQPFCDFLDMIRPLVIAGAWLLSAFMYVGVLRRG